MAKDPLYAWFIRGFFLLLILLACHLVLKGLEWTIGPAYAAVLAIIAALFIGSWVFKGPLWPAFSASVMMVAVVVFYAMLRRVAHFGDSTASMEWTHRALAVLALFSCALLLGLLADREGAAPGLMAVLFVTGIGCLAYADSRFLVDPLLGPRAASKVTVNARRPLHGVAAAHGALWSLALVWGALRRRRTPLTARPSSDSR